MATAAKQVRVRVRVRVRARARVRVRAQREATAAKQAEAAFLTHGTPAPTVSLGVEKVSRPKAQGGGRPCLCDRPC